MSGKFEPKAPVQLAPPKDDIISLEELSQATGVDGGKCYVAIKGIVYDVTGNKVYQPGGSYHVFAGKDASQALAKSSKEVAHISPEWKHLDAKEQGVLNDWVTFFSKRYSIVGKVEGATNFE